MLRLTTTKTFTGQQLARDWHRAQCIAAAASAGLSVRDIAAGFNCSVNVVTRVLGVVAERAPEVVTAMRKRLSGQMTLLTQMLATSLVEDLANGRLKPEHKPVALGIVATQSALLAGDPTARVERTNGPDPAKLAERLGVILDVETVTTDPVSDAEHAASSHKAPVVSGADRLDTDPTTPTDPIQAVDQAAAGERSEPLGAGPGPTAGAKGEGGGGVFDRGAVTSLTGLPPQNLGEGASA